MTGRRGPQDVSAGRDDRTPHGRGLLHRRIPAACIRNGIAADGTELLRRDFRLGNGRRTKQRRGDYSQRRTTARYPQEGPAALQCALLAS